MLSNARLICGCVIFVPTKHIYIIIHFKGVPLRFYCYSKNKESVNSITFT